jgi:hypothetical protein
MYSRNVGITPPSEIDTDAGERAGQPYPVSWKATFGIIGIFCLGVMLTQLVVFAALYIGPRLFP